MSLRKTLTSCGKLFSTLPIVLVAMACPEKALAFSGNWNYEWGAAEDSDLNISTAINRTCFLSGVAGNLHGTAPTSTPRGPA